MFSNMFSGILTGCFANFTLFMLLNFLFCFRVFFYDCQNQFRPYGSRQCCYLMASIKYYKLISTIYAQQKSCNNNDNNSNGIDAFNLIDNFVFLVKLILFVCICLSLSRFISGFIPKKMMRLYCMNLSKSGWFLCKQSMPRGSSVHGSWQRFFMWMPRRKERSWLQPNPTNGMCDFFLLSFLN